MAWVSPDSLLSGTLANRSYGASAVARVSDQDVLSVAIVEEVPYTEFQIVTVFVVNSRSRRFGPGMGFWRAARVESGAGYTMACRTPTIHPEAARL